VCSAPTAAATATEDVPVPGGSAALSRLLGIDPPPDRGRFIYEITRLIYDNPEGRRPEAVRYIEWLRQPPGRKREVRPAPDRAATDSIPVPLTADVWGDAIFHRRLAREELVSAIVADRSASLLCHGLAPLDDQTLQYFADHPALLSRIYDRSAPAFAAFSSSLRVRANRVVPPTERDDVVAMWEAVVGEKMTRAGSIHPAAAGHERRTRRGALRHHRSARRTAPRVCPGILDPRRRRASGSFQDAGHRRHQRVSRVARPYDAVQPVVVRSRHDAGADRGRRQWHACRTELARFLDARLLGCRRARGCGAAAAERRRTSRWMRRGWRTRLDRPMSGSAPSASNR
jgi:hypothetical protein